MCPRRQVAPPKKSANSRKKWTKYPAPAPHLHRNRWACTYVTRQLSSCHPPTSPYSAGRKDVGKCEMFPRGEKASVPCVPLLYLSLPGAQIKYPDRAERRAYVCVSARPRQMALSIPRRRCSVLTRKWQPGLRELLDIKRGPLEATCTCGCCICGRMCPSLCVCIDIQ